MESFSGDARAALATARRYAGRESAAAIGSEHIVRAVLATPGTRTSALLAAAGLGATLPGFDASAESLPALSAAGAGLPYSAEAKSAILRARLEADQLSDTMVEPHHLLIAAITVSEALAKSLADQGVSTDRLREAARRRR